MNKGTLNGMVFKTYQTEYEVPISGNDADVLRFCNQPGWAERIKALPFPVHITLNIADDMGWAFFVTLLAEDDTTANRDLLADTLKAHIDACKETVV